MRVLVVNMNYLGDALMTTPTLALLHRSASRAVDVIAGGASGYAAVEVLRNNPDVDQLISRVDGGAFARCRQLYKAIRRGSYDLVVVLPSIPAYAWAARLAGAKDVLYVPQSPESSHMAEHMLHIVAARLGAPAGPLQMVLRIGEEARASAERLLADLPDNAPLIGLNIGATRAQKRWPAELFAETLRRLHSRGYNVALLGSPSDKAAASRIMAAAGPGVALDLTGQTSIADLCGVIARCTAVVTGDTGAMHIASALEVPVVALFGSTDPAQTGPIGQGRSRVIYKQLACAPCKNHPTCGGAFTCMTSIAPLEVIGAAEQLIERAPKQPRLQIVSS